MTWESEQNRKALVGSATNGWIIGPHGSDRPTFGTNVGAMAVRRIYSHKGNPWLIRNEFNYWHPPQHPYREQTKFLIIYGKN